LGELDAERDENQRLADIRSEEIVEMSRDFAALQAALAGARQETDKLQASIGAGTQQLQEHQRSKALEDQRAQALSQSMITLRKEAREKTVEAGEIMDDIMYMTKENQKLHEETRVFEQRVAQLTDNARDQAAKQQLTSQRVQAIELERNDIAALYERASWHTRQEALIVERMRTRAENSSELAARLEGELSQSARGEEESEVRVKQLRLDASVLEGQLQDVEARLSQEEQIHQSVIADGAQFESDIASAAAVREGAGHREVVHAHAAVALRLRLQQVHAAVVQAQAKIVQDQRSLAEGHEQVRRLEALFEEERRRAHQCAAENESLRQCLEARQGSPSSAADATELAKLRQEVDRRYAEVSLCDEEQQAMVAEVARLQAALRSR